MPAATPEPVNLDAMVRRMQGAFRAGDNAVAQVLCQQVLERAPQTYAALMLRGVLLAKSGDSAGALTWFDQAAAADPVQPGVHNNRGNALMTLAQYAEAAQAYEQAIKLGGEAAHAHTQRAMALLRTARPDAALDGFERALELDASHLPAHFERIDLLIEIGRHGDAIKALHAALAAGGDDTLIDFALAALGAAGHAPPRTAAPVAYVRELFDRYAPTFEQHLLGRLEYHVPALMAEAVATLAAAEPGKTYDIIDLGCGTGLCAEPLAPFKRSLVGVDLSPRMLQQAHARQIYDALHEAEMVAFLASCPLDFDLAIACDVLNYFGDLVAPLAAVHGALRPGGRFVFTVEASDGDGDSVTLHATRRFTHTHSHVLRAARGYTLLRAQPCTLRLEHGVPVAGRLFVIQRD